MPKVTVNFQGHACEVTSVDHFPLEVFISNCQRELHLPRRWRDDLYAAGMSWNDAVATDLSVTLYEYYEVKVHFAGKKAKVRCTVGNKLQDIVAAVARDLKLPTDWQTTLTIENGLTWQTQFSTGTQIYLKDPRRQG
jgi:hypothetical protein